MKASALLPVVAFSLALGSASAALVEYAVDQGASLFRVTGTMAGATLTDQSPGTATTGLQGFLGGQREAGTLSIETHSLQAVDQLTPQLPITGSGDVGSPFGLRGISPTAGQILVNIESLSFFVSTGFGQPLDVADGRFAPSDIGFFIDGSLSFSADAIALRIVDMHGRGAPNVATGEGTLTVNGDVETLTIPITTTFSLDAISENDTTLTISGDLVARRTIPEPTTAAVLGLVGAVSFLSRRQR